MKKIKSIVIFWLIQSLFCNLGTDCDFDKIEICFAGQHKQIIYFVVMLLLFSSVLGLEVIDKLYWFPTLMCFVSLLCCVFYFSNFIDCVWIINKCNWSKIKLRICWMHRLNIYWFYQKESTHSSLISHLDNNVNIRERKEDNVDLWNIHWLIHSCVLKGLCQLPWLSFIIFWSFLNLILKQRFCSCCWSPQ